MSTSLHFAAGNAAVKESIFTDVPLMNRLEPVHIERLLNILLSYIIKSGNTARSDVAACVEQTACDSRHLDLTATQRLAKCLLHVLKQCVHHGLSASQLRQDFAQLGVNASVIDQTLVPVWLRCVADSGCSHSPDHSRDESRLERAPSSGNIDVSNRSSTEAISRDTATVRSEERVNALHHAEPTEKCHKSRPLKPPKPILVEAKRASIEHRPESSQNSGLSIQSAVDRSETSPADGEAMNPPVYDGQIQIQNSVRPIVSPSIVVRQMNVSGGYQGGEHNMRRLKSSDCRVAVTLASSDSTRKGSVSIIVRFHWENNEHPANTVRGRCNRHYSSCVQLSPDELCSLLSQLQSELHRLTAL